MVDNESSLLEAELPGAEAPESLLQAMIADQPPARAEDLPVMENITDMNRSRYFEAAGVRGKSWKTRICTAIGVIAMVTGMFLTSMGIFLIGLAGALLAVFSHVIIAYRDFGKIKRFHPSGEWQKTIRFYEDRIETDSGIGAVSAVKYKDIRREFETPRMYVIDFGKTAPATTLYKNSFVIGSIDSLREFLLEKRRGEYAPEQNESPVSNA